MSFFRKEKKDDYYAQAMKIEHTPSKKNTIEKKRNKIIATYNEPVLPKFTKILFISMFVLTGVMLAQEIVNYIRYKDIYSISRLFSNLTLTCLIIWAIYAVVLAVVSFIGMYLQARDYNKKKAESGIIDSTPEETARSKRAISKLNYIYRRYIIISAAGLVFWLIFFIVTRLVIS